MAATVTPENLEALRLLLEQRSAEPAVDMEDAEVMASALDTWSNGHEATAWLHRPHPLLGGRTPAAVAAEGNAGRKQVLDLLGRLRSDVAP